MNLILLHDADFISAERVVLRDRRREHIRAVHRAEVGDQLRVGRLNGLCGNGTILRSSGDELELEVRLDTPPPAPLPLTLLLALPRPKMLKRILQTVSALGVKDIYLINSYRVDKSYWSSPLLQPEQFNEQLILGLEQARDTQLPRVELRPRFKPFVEDETPELIRGTTAYVAHPGVDRACPSGTQGATTLAIGPEGGFIPYEVELLQNNGFLPVSLGERILRVETAVPVLLTRLAPVLDQ
ncbi:MAG: 16S rRNA (uracil(1498)-N(3))-methyltransferase [Desulfuromonas sp.]|nr:MAG: 16S rRNA (uracil(1498)-N(3))-methyltransferase [Desulfuromonas sp.]